MINLYDETIEVLENHGKTENDVRYVISHPFYTDWEHFKLNSKFEYDNGYGWPVINSNLKIVGDYWWLERVEYDGAEHWTYKQKPDVFNFRKASPGQIMEMIRG